MYSYKLIYLVTRSHRRVYLQANPPRGKPPPLLETVVILPSEGADGMFYAHHLADHTHVLHQFRSGCKVSLDVYCRLHLFVFCVVVMVAKFATSTYR